MKKSIIEVYRHFVRTGNFAAARCILHVLRRGWYCFHFDNAQERSAFYALKQFKGITLKSLPDACIVKATTDYIEIDEDELQGFEPDPLFAWHSSRRIVI